jgi:peptidyl-prolyl cis-trans isomerase D
MLETLRSAAGTWVAKILLLLLVLSFAVWGISGEIAGIGSGDAVVTAGGTEVSGTEYRLAYDRQVNVLSQRLGQPLTREMATALGLDNQVLSQLVAGAVLDEQARLLKLGLSEDRIAALTAEDPAFQGPDGRFDRQRFDYVLSQVGMRPEDYFADRAQVATRQQIVEAVTDGLEVPETFLRAAALYRGEDRTAEYVVLPKTLVDPAAAPDDAVLSAWFEERKWDYAAPEYRRIAYVKLEPEDIADEAAIAEEDVRADYERDRARYTTPETRTIEQLVFANREAAETALASLKAGSTFDQLVTGEGKTPADVALGTLSREQVPDPAVAEAAFALPAGSVSEIVDGAFGPILVRVTAVTPEVVRPYEEVAAAIRSELATAEASRVLLDVHDSYEDARAGGATLTEAAERLGLKVTVVDAVSRSGQRPDDTVVTDLPASADLLRETFETEVDVENVPVNLGSNGFLFYEVQGVTPARDRTLDEVKARVTEDWIAAEAQRLLAERSVELEKRLKDGETLDAIAAELGLEKQTKRGLRRQADDPDFGAPGVAAVFALPVDGAGSFAAPGDAGTTLFRVTEVFEPAAADAASVPEQERDGLSAGLADDLLDQMVARLRSQFDVRVDQNAVARAMAF